MDISLIKTADDWPFHIPEITREAIDDYLAALKRDDPSVGDYYDALDGCTREMSNEDEETEVRNYYLRNEWWDAYDKAGIDPHATD